MTTQVLRLPARSDAPPAAPRIAVRDARITRTDGSRGFTLLVPELDVPEGSVTAIVGPSGSGKSTLLVWLAGHLPSSRRLRATWSRWSVRLPSQGRLSCRARRDLRRVQAHTSLVLQGGQLVPSLSLTDNTRAVAYASHDDVARLLGAQGLSPQADHVPEALSGGQHRRGLLARALATPAALLALDEPCTGLDADRAAQTMDALLAQARAQRRTVLWVTHNVSHAQALADQLVHVEPDPSDARSIVSPARTLRCTRTTPGDRLPQARRCRGVHLGLAALFGRGARRCGVPFGLLRQAAPVAVLAAFVIVLLGLRGGAIEQLEMSVRRSPTARRLWVTGPPGQALAPATLASVVAASSALDVAVPIASDFGPRTLRAGTRTVDHVRLRATGPGDPLLPMVPQGLKGRTVAIGRTLQETLGVKIGDTVRMRVGATPRAPDIVLEVRAVRDEGGKPIVRAPYAVLRGLARWLAGHSAPVLGDAFLRTHDRATSPAAAYPHLLLLATHAPSDEARNALAAYGTLRPAPEIVDDLCRALGLDRRPHLRAYTLTRLGGYVAGADPHVPRLLRRAEEAAASWMDARVLPWVPPLDVSVGNDTLRLVGLSISRPRWLRKRLPAAVAPFRWTDASALARTAVALDAIDLRVGEQRVRVPVVREPATTGARAAIVPAAFLARLRALQGGALRWEDGGSQGGRFLARAGREPALLGAWVYARDARGTVTARSDLAAAGLRVRQDSQRAHEVVRTASMLTRLTTVAGWLIVPVVFLLSLVLFGSSFQPLARALSSLRVAGVGRGACLAFLWVRGLTMGLLALGGAALLGMGVSALVHGPMATACQPSAWDVGVVMGSLLCVCALAALVAAWRIVRRDPIAVLTLAAREV